MGTMAYGGWTVEFDDRLLTHLQIVIINRLHRGNSLLMSWIDSTTIGDGRSAMWITPGAPIFFKFAGSRVPSIDQAWLQRLEASAASSTGLIVTDETGHPTPANQHGGSHRIDRTRLPAPQSH